MLRNMGACIGGVVFFFSSRRRHTRFDCDWSSDVCSSDLPLAAAREAGVPVVSEIDLGFRALAGSGTRRIAITRTNGKTTTTALVAHPLRAAGLAAEPARDTGPPLTDIALTRDRYQRLGAEAGG